MGERLLDRLKLQEGATMRVEEQLAALEQYLGRPEEGLKCLAHYQLRAVWRAASRRLEHFAGELARRQKDSERKQQQAAFERAKRERLADVERELTEARVLADQLQAEQRLAEQQLASLAGFWNHFRRRRLREAIAALRFRIDAAVTQVTDLADRWREVDAEPPPLFEGLGIDGRRAVNLAVIACAESLHERVVVRTSDRRLAGGPITFSAIGDAPYGNDEIPVFLQQLEDHRRYSRARFMVHVGDIFGGSDPCDEERYQWTAEWLKAMDVPVYIVPGDNEWVDCDDPDQAWAFWNTYLLRLEEHFCGTQPTEYQSVRPENFAFVQNGVLFIGVNVVAGSPDAPMIEGADWVQAQLAAKKGTVRAAVVFSQTGPSSSRALFFDRFGSCTG